MPKASSTADEYNKCTRCSTGQVLASANRKLCEKCRTKSTQTKLGIRAKKANVELLKDMHWVDQSGALTDAAIDILDDLKSKFPNDNDWESSGLDNAHVALLKTFGKTTGVKRPCCSSANDPGPLHPSETAVLQAILSAKQATHSHFCFRGSFSVNLPSELPEDDLAKHLHSFAHNLHKYLGWRFCSQGRLRPKSGGLTIEYQCSQDSKRKPRTKTLKDGTVSTMKYQGEHYPCNGLLRATIDPGQQHIRVFFHHDIDHPTTSAESPSKSDPPLISISDLPPDLAEIAMPSLDYTLGATSCPMLSTGTTTSAYSTDSYLDTSLDYVFPSPIYTRFHFLSSTLQNLSRIIQSQAVHEDSRFLADLERICEPVVRLNEDLMEVQAQVDLGGHSTGKRLDGTQWYRPFTTGSSTQ